MKKYVKFLLFTIIFLLISVSFNNVVAKNESVYKVEKNQRYDATPFFRSVNRKHLVAHVSGEIKISEILNFTETEYTDLYKDILLNGTVINSTLLDPFTLWPPFSFLPFLKTIHLPDEYTVYLKIKLFDGKFYVKDDGEKVRFYGSAFFVDLRARPKKSPNNFPSQI